MTVVRGVPLDLYQYEAVSEAIRQAGDFYEAEILDDLRERHPVARTIVDAGANIGNHSAYWSRFVPHDAIHAFEPVPENFALLVRNLAHDPTAVCHQLALSNVASHLGMTVDRVNMGRSRIDGGTLRVEAVPLDSFALPDVSLLKIDTEGHEALVLAGAVETVRRCHPVILVEQEGDDFDWALVNFGLARYRRMAVYPGSNHLWEWQ